MPKQHMNIDQQAIVNRFYSNHQKDANIYLKNLLSLEDYSELLGKCIEQSTELIFNRQSKDDILYSLHDTIYKTSNIEMEADNLICKQRLASGMVVTYGTANYRDIYYVGNQQEIDDSGNEALIPMTRESIFDLSSITKLFTCICLLQYVDKGLIKLSDYIGIIDNRFINLTNVTIEELLAFKVPLKTIKRIDMANSLEDAESLIFNIEIGEAADRVYTDMGAMVLKYLIERIANKSFFDVIYQSILLPCGMKNTHFIVRNLSKVVSNNFERRVIDSNYIINDSVKKGVVNDGKARKINEFEKQLCGHAGLFSTAEDISKFAQAILKEQILSKEMIREIGINRTGERKSDGSYSQFHGYLCYSKNPIRENSEVSHWLSGNSFALGGYTGNHLMIDFNNQVFTFLASNRCHNRITYIDSKSMDAVVSDGGVIRWNDGKEYVDSSRFAYDRNDMIEILSKTALQCRCVELILQQVDSIYSTGACDRNIHC